MTGDRTSDPEAEMAVLGAMLLDRNAGLRCRDALEAEHFADPGNAAVFKVACRMLGDGEKLDIVLLRDAIAANGAAGLIDVSPAEFVTRISASVPTVAHAGEYATLVREAHARRQVKRLASELLDDNGVATPSEVSAKLRAQADALEVSERSRSESLVDIVARAVKDLTDPNAKSVLVPTGIFELDQDVGGLPRGAVTLIAARPGHGKTALAAQIALEFANRGEGVAWLSLEMSREAMALRNAACIQSVPMERIVQPERLTADDIARLDEAVKVMKHMPMVIDDRMDLGIGALRLAARQVEAIHNVPPSLVVLDYVQLVKAPKSEAKYSSKEAELAWVSREAVRIAKDLDCCVILVAQLNREGARTNRMPRASDLRGSGSLEQDASLILLLHNPDATAHATDEGAPEDPVILVDKHRNGRCGAIRANFDGSTMRWFAPEGSEW